MGDQLAQLGADIGSEVVGKLPGDPAICEKSARRGGNLRRHRRGPHPLRANRQIANPPHATVTPSNTATAIIGGKNRYFSTPPAASAT